MPLILAHSVSNSRSQKCREMAGEAECLAANGTDKFHAHYSDLAARWGALANEMEATQILNGS